MKQAMNTGRRARETNTSWNNTLLKGRMNRAKAPNLIKEINVKSGRAKQKPRFLTRTCGWQLSNKQSRIFRNEATPSGGGLVRLDCAGAGKFSLGLRSPRSQPSAVWAALKKAKELEKTICPTWDLYYLRQAPIKRRVVCCRRGVSAFVLAFAIRSILKPVQEELHFVLKAAGMIDLTERAARCQRPMYLSARCDCCCWRYETNHPRKPSHCFKSPGGTNCHPSSSSVQLDFALLWSMGCSNPVLLIIRTTARDRNKVIDSREQLPIDHVRFSHLPIGMKRELRRQ